MILYVNGVIDGSSSITLGTTGSFYKVGRGINGGGQEPFNGTIDDIRVWNTVRTQGQIQSAMDAELAGNEAGLVAYYRLNQGIAGGNNAGITTALDQKGHHGTMYNFTLDGPSSNWVEGKLKTLNLTNDAPASFPTGTTTVTWTATDPAGNTATCQQTVTVADLIPPIITLQKPVPPSLPAPPSIVSNVPEAAEYNLVYALDLPDNANWDELWQIPYGTDNTGSLAGTDFDRLAYMMELDDQWVWVSMDAFTQDITQSGIPTGELIFQQRVDNMNVFASPGAPVVTGTGITTGNIEFWSHCYGTNVILPGIGGDPGLYDFNDESTSPNCYGSFQVHNWGAQQTLFAANAWSIGWNMDLGIGNNPIDHPDWTYSGSAPSYGVKRLYVFMRPTVPLCNTDLQAIIGPGQCSASVNFYGSAEDNCEGVTLTIDPPSGTQFTVGTHQVLATATDASGNTSTCTFTVSVESEYTVGDGGMFPTLTGQGGLFEYINTTGLCSDIVAKVISDIEEPGTNSLVAWTEINQDGPYSLTIVPDQPMLRNITGNVSQDMIRIDGADRLTIDGRFEGQGRYLLFRNQYAFSSTFTFKNDACYIILRNCFIEGANRVSAGGVINIGTGVITGNDNYLITENILRNVSPAIVPNNMITSNNITTKINSGIVISGNEFSNFRSAGILVSGYGSALQWTITDNVFYYNLPSPCSTPQSVINFQPALATTYGNVISGNRIGGSDAFNGGPAWTNSSGSAFKAINVKYGTCAIEDNLVTNITLSSTGAASFTGIELYVTSGAQSTLRWNTVESVTLAGTGNFTGILSTSTTPLQWIEGNTIGEIHYTSTGTGSPVITGISAKKAQVRKNIIHSLDCSGTNLTPKVYGIHFFAASGTTNECSNNMVSLGSGSCANPLLYGIYEGSAANSTANYYYNSVLIHGTASAVKNSYCFYRQNSVKVTLKNNLFSNLRSGSPMGQYAIYTASGTYWMYSDYNDLYTAQAPLASWAGYDKSTLALWRSSSGKDLHSVSVLPDFTSNDDLHLTPLNVGLDGKGIPVAGFTTDIDGNFRNGSTPDIGADEFDALVAREEPDSNSEVITGFHSMEVFPNPFSSTATIVIRLDMDQEVEISVYDIVGKKVSILASGILSKGSHIFTFNSGDLPNGIYVSRMVVTGQGSIVKRLQLLK